MHRKFMFIDTESLEDYYLSISDKADVNNIKKFNELYKYLEENNLIKDLKENIEELNVGDIIEMNITVKIPKMYMQINQFSKIAPFFGHAQNLGIWKMKSETDIKILEEMKGVSNLIKDQNIPIIGESNNKKLKIVTDINNKFLKVGLKEFEGEITIIGKVKSIIKKGKGIDVYNLMPEMDKIIPNRGQRRKLKKENPDLIEHVSGPALEIYTLAMYR